MASIDHQGQPTYTGRRTLLDDWRAEVGDEGIARIVHEVRRDAAAGLIPGFTDQESLLAHWRKLAGGA